MESLLVFMNKNYKVMIIITLSLVIGFLISCEINQVKSFVYIFGFMVTLSTFYVMITDEEENNE